jgi:hypothetical protein
MLICVGRFFPSKSIYNGNGSKAACNLTAGISSLVKLSDVQIYPIPAHESIVVSSENEVMGTVSVLNIFGEEVISNTSFGTTIRKINCENLAPAWYTVKIEFQNYTVHKPFVKN